MKTFSQIKFRLIQSTGLWLSVLLITLVAILTYGPLMPRLGFYRDDWYQLWAGNTLGASSIITLFSIDRPVMGYLYAGTYALLGNNPISWQIYSLFLRWLGALGFLWLLRRIWPAQRLATTSAVLLFLVYPGFLQQPNANTFSNHLFGYTSGILSLAATTEALCSQEKLRRIAFTMLAITSGFGCWLIYEYMIGLEGLRFLLITLLLWRSDSHSNRKFLPRLVGHSIIYLIPISGFLIWRLFIFESSRAAIDVSSLITRYSSSPLRMAGKRLLELAKDYLEVTFLGWSVPTYNTLSLTTNRDALYAMGLAIVVMAVYLLFIKRMFTSQSIQTPSSEADNFTAYRSFALIGTFTVLSTLLPVVIAGRDIRWDSALDRYTLHVTVGVSLFVIGLIFYFIRPLYARVLAVAFLLGLSVFTHYNNAVLWANFWEEQRQLWWQLSWRAPQLQPNTTLLVKLPNFGFFEDYEVWAPANLIYAPGEKRPQIAAEVFSELSADYVRLGHKDVREMRVLIEISRDYNQTLILAWPTSTSCVHILESKQLEFPDQTESMIRSIGKFADENLIDINALPSTPPTRIFGPEPEHEWCWYYQKATLARQQGNWDEVIRLGDKVMDVGLKPIDRSEWMPFFQAYVNTGRDETANILAIWIRDVERTRHTLCDYLSDHYFNDQEAYLHGRNMLCAFD